MGDLPPIVIPLVKALPHLEYSEHPPFWEDFYLEKYFGIELPLSLYKYGGINEIVLSSGRKVVRYCLQIE